MELQDLGEFLRGFAPVVPGGVGYFGSMEWRRAYPVAYAQYLRAALPLARVCGCCHASRGAGGVACARGAGLFVEDGRRGVVGALGGPDDAGVGVGEVVGSVVGGVRTSGSGVAGECGRDHVVGVRRTAREGSVRSAVGGVAAGAAVGSGERRRGVGVSVSVSSAGADEVVGVTRGKHYAKNKAKREFVKAKKRAGAAVGVGLSGDSSSAFAECDQAKVRELREKQLDALIVENEWKKQQFSRKMWRSDAYLSSDNKRVFKSELEAEDTMLRLAKKRGVQGWAETVLSGSTANRQSVHSAWSAKGKTESVSADSSVSDEAREAKLVALEKKVKALELEVDTYRMKYGSDSGYDESYEPGLFESR